MIFDKLKDFLLTQAEIKEIKEDNNITIKEKEKEENEDLLAMYCCGIFDEMLGE